MPARVSTWTQQGSQRTQSMRVQGMLWGLSAAAIPITLLVIVGLLAQDRIGRASVESYGSTITAQLAALSAAPLVTHDYIDLNVITNNLADDPAIINAAIYTLDNRLLSTGGRVPEEATRSAPPNTVFKRDITFEAQRVGYVRVVVDAGTVAPPTSLWFFGAAIIGALGAGILGARLGAAQERRLQAVAERLARATPEAPAQGSSSAAARLDALARIIAPDPEPPAPPAEPSNTAASPYLLAVNLFNQGSLAPRDRDAVYAACEQRMLRMLELHKGKLVRLPGTGLLAVLECIEGDDHAFSAICAAMLALRLTGALNDERERQQQVRIGLRGGLLRLDRVPRAQAEDALLDELDPDVGTVLALSATAKNQALAIDRAIFEDLLDNQRVQWSAIRSAITAPGDGGRFHYQIGGLAANQEALLVAQTEKLLVEPAPTGTRAAIAAAASVAAARATDTPAA